MNILSKVCVLAVISVLSIIPALAEYQARPSELSDLAAKEYNKLSSVAVLMKSAEVKKVLHNLGYTPNDKLPSLKAVGNHLASNDKELEGIKIYVLSKKVIVNHKGQILTISSSTTPAQVLSQVQNFFTPQKTTDSLSFFISPAYAQSLQDRATMAIDRVRIALIFGSLAVAEIIDDLQKGLRELAQTPIRMRERNTRERATAACEAIQRNHPVRDLEETKRRLIALKAEVDCVPEWESVMHNSCGWFDERIECLSAGSSEVHDSGRNSGKDLPTPVRNSPSSGQAVTKE